MSASLIDAANMVNNAMPIGLGGKLCGLLQGNYILDKPNKTGAYPVFFCCFCVGLAFTTSCGLARNIRLKTSSTLGRFDGSLSSLPFS